MIIIFILVIQITVERIKGAFHMILLSEQTIQHLNKFHLFKGLDNKELENMLYQATVKTFDKGEIIFFQYEPITHLYFVVVGQIRLYRIGENGQELTLQYVTKDDLLPHSGYTHIAKYPSYAEAIAPSKVITIPIKRFREITSNNDIICKNINCMMEQQIIDLTNRLEEKVCRDIPNQILSLLLRLESTIGIKENSSWTRISIRLSNRELANMIGLRRETMSRYMNKIKNQGYINYSQEGHLMIKHEEIKQLLQMEWN